jgi:glycosyltransferase involved in cell wall biosynthesis
MSEKISVIIPVYQAKNYLNKCVSSVINQSYENVEVILVDDGAVDGSAEMCDRLGEQDSRIVVKHIYNSGPYAARNIGVEISQGDIVTFVDADDYVEKNAYSELMKIYEKYNPDIITYSYKTNKGIENIYYDAGFYNREKIEEIIMPTMMYDTNIGARKLNPSLYSKIMKKDIYMNVMKIKEKNINWGDDALITYPAVCIADSVYVSHEAYYNYCNNCDSSTHKSPSARIDELEKFYIEIRNSLKVYDNRYGFEFQTEAYMKHFFNMFIKNRFGKYFSLTGYIFPYADIAYGSKVQIYGAGNVGKSYVCELQQSKYAEIVGWYDYKAEDLVSYAGVGIDLPEKINEVESDVVLIAIQNKDIAKDIENELKKMGVESDKIIWTIPKVRW